MCGSCGCGTESVVRVGGRRIMPDTGPAHGPAHGPGRGVGDREAHHGHERGHHRHGVDARMLAIEQRVLAKNDELAAENRRALAERQVVAVNVMGTPGAGKTTLLVRTLAALAGEVPVAVVEGDQETDVDAARIRAVGCPVVQVNTGQGCHLDAGMMARAMTELDPDPGSLLLVENVGNLVCPALFDLGESRRVVVMSATEGVDKPVKYPHMFRAADAVIINKADLLPHVEFDVEHCRELVRQVAPAAVILVVSATSGAGLAEWTDWLRGARHAPGSEPVVAPSA